MSRSVFPTVEISCSDPVAFAAESLGGAVWRITDGASESRLDIKTIDLDTLCAERDVRPDALKIDVEGGEAFVPDGARRALGSARVIVLEFHEPQIRERGCDPQEVVARLESLGRGVKLLGQKRGLGPAPGSPVTASDTIAGNAHLVVGG